MSSNAVSEDLISKIVGYKIVKGDFRERNENLPMRIAVLGEANESNQVNLDLTPKEITSVQQAGNLYGYGSPIYHVIRILKPSLGEGVGSIPVVVYPQAKAGGATAQVFDIVPVGTATKSGTHTLVIAGRKGLEGARYDIRIEKDDTVADITAKIEDAVNAVLGSPVSADSTNLKATLTSKWMGLTAAGITVSVDTNNDSLGISYGINGVASGSGTPNVTPALESFSNDWNTIVINTYGTVPSVMDALENFNGIPDPENPTGRYFGIIWKPFIALIGSVAEDPSNVTAPRKDQVTIALCPAPLSKGLPFEAAANMAVLFARQAQDTPHLDVAGRFYPDMPAPTSIGAMANYLNRDTIVKKGCSTVDLVGGRYQVQDFVTTYHKDGENPPQYRYCRNLMIDFNVKYGYYLKELINVAEHAIASDSDIVSVAKVVKPKQWKQIVSEYADSLVKRGLTVDPKFMQDSIVVNISTVNPDRLETSFNYKRSGFARIASTTAAAGFNFGTLNA